MDPEDTSPIVSFSRDGEEFVLDSGDEQAPSEGFAATLIYGMQGVGLPPVEVSSEARVGGHGNVVRGVRYGAREVYVPFLMEAGSTAELSEKRRELTRLLAPHRGQVTVRIQDPATGTDRTIEGYFKDGLEGNLSEGYHGSWQAVGLTFECNDPMWSGPWRRKELRIAPGVKPFLSDTIPFFPVILNQSNASGNFEVDIAGDEPVLPVWEITGPGKDLRISAGKKRWVEIDGTFRAGETLTYNAKTGRMTPDRWDDTSARTRPFALGPGPETIAISMVEATPDSVVAMTFRERYLEGY